MSLKKRMDWYGNVRYTICFYFSVYLYTSTPLENKIIFTELCSIINHEGSCKGYVRRKVYKRLDYRLDF